MTCLACGREGPINGSELCARCDGRDAPDRDGPGPVAAVVAFFLLIVFAALFIV